MQGRVMETTVAMESRELTVLLNPMTLYFISLFENIKHPFVKNSWSNVSLKVLT